MSACPVRTGLTSRSTRRQAYFNEWSCSRPPALYKRAHDWAPLRWLAGPLTRLGVLRPHAGRGMEGTRPRRLDRMVHWRPLAGLAHRAWIWAGKPGYLERFHLS
jgi:hypothetical protein